MEVIFGILAAFLQFNFFSILLFAALSYGTYYDIYTSLMGVSPKLTLYPSTMLPPLGAGLDGVPVFGAYLFLFIFVLLMLYHITTYLPFWSVLGIFFLVVFAFQVVSGMGGVSSFLMFILKIGGILLAIALALFLLFVGSLIVWDKKEEKKYKERLRRKKAVEEWKNGASV